MVVNTYLSRITLNVNSFNAPTKRHSVAEGISKQDPYICCLQETHLRMKDTYKHKSKGIEKDISCKWKGKACWGSNTYIRQNRPQNKGYIKKKRRKLHNDKGVNLTKVYNLCTFMHPA